MPKGSKVRDIVVPDAQHIATGIDLRQLLANRSAEALAEQAAGSNPRALLFPTLRGRVWNDNNLRNRVWAPAADALGWRMAPYETVTGAERSMLRFTLHSLRDRYATTAISDWHYTEEQILLQGSWEDSETVRRYYSGITDQTHNSVRQLHGLAATK